MNRVQSLMASVHQVPEWIRLGDRGITTGVAQARDANQKVRSPFPHRVTADTATGYRLHSPLYYPGQREDQTRMTLGHNLRRSLRAVRPGGLNQSRAQEAA